MNTLDIVRSHLSYGSLSFKSGHHIIIMTVVANQVLAGKNELLIGSPIRFDS